MGKRGVSRLIGSDPAVGPVRVADALGYASVALGVPMVVAPRRLLRAIGVEDDERPTAAVLAVGVREHVAALTILAMRQRRIGVSSRVVGDTLDLALLVQAHRSRRADGERLRRAMAAVGALLLTDLVTAVALARAEGVGVPDGSRSSGEGARHEDPGGHTRVRTAVTIRRPREEVRQAFSTFGWSAFDPAALEASGEVRFTAAPGDRGTELHLDHEPARGGAAALAAKLVGRSPDQDISDELRRFKALLETGVVPRSDKAPEGASSRRQILHKRRPAQPVGKGS